MKSGKMCRSYLRQAAVLTLTIGLMGALPADWNTPEQVSRTSGVSTAPGIACTSAGQKYITWQEGAEFNYPEVYFSRRDSSGWTNPLNLSNTSALHSNLPNIGYLFGKKKLCLVWYEEEGQLSSVMYARTSSDNGASWTEAEQLSSGMEGASQFPHFIVDNQGVGHLVWSEYYSDTGDPYFAIAYRRTNGSDWSELENANQTPTHSGDHPSVWAQGSSNVAVLYLNNNKTSEDRADWSINTVSKNGSEWSAPLELYRAGLTPIFTRVVRTVYGETYYFFLTRGAGTGNLYYCYQESSGGSISEARHFGSGILDKTRFSAIEGKRGNVHVFFGGPGGLFHHLFEDGGLVCRETVTTASSQAPCAVYNGSLDQIYLAYQDTQKNEIYCVTGEEPYEGDIDPGVNRRPTARITMNRSEGLTPLSVTFSAANSTDRDGTIVSYSWAFGDGGTASGVKATHVYGDTGDYTVLLKVKDDDGASDTASAAVYALGVEPPLGTKADHGTNRSLFTTEHYYKVTWEANPVNAERGFDIVSYNVYRRGEGENWYSRIGNVGAGEELVYLDRSLGRQYIVYYYTVTSVDAAGRESPLPIIY